MIFGDKTSVEMTDGREQNLNSWAMRDDLGLVRAVLAAIWNIIFHPKIFFRSITDSHPISEAFKFYFASLITQAIIAGIMVALNPMAWPAILGTIGTLFSFLSVLIIVIVAFIAFVGIAMTIFIISFIMHLFVLIFRGKGGFSGTFSILSYGNAAQILFILIAPIGLFLLKLSIFSSGILLSCLVLYVIITLIWYSAIQIIGYREVHKIGTVKAAFIFLLPMMIFMALQLGLSSAHIKGYLNGIFPAIVKLQTKAGIISPIGWKYELNSALEEAGKKKTLVMADFYTDWCGWCKKLDKETYQDKEVIDLARRFVCAKVDGSKHMDVIKKSRINAYPTIIFFNPRGDEEKRVDGYIDARKLAGIMKDLLQKNNIPIETALPSEKTYPEKKIEVVKGGFQLNGIVSSGGGYMAIINDVFVKAGDAIADAKVVKITKHEVRLSGKNGREIILNT